MVGVSVRGDHEIGGGKEIRGCKKKVLEKGVLNGKVWGCPWGTKGEGIGIFLGRGVLMGGKIICF